MTTQKKDNRGYLYPNKNKTKTTQPDYTGSVIVDQVDWRIAGWDNVTSSGEKYISILFSPPQTVSNTFSSNQPQSSSQNNSQSNIQNNDLEDLDKILEDIEDPFK